MIDKELYIHPFEDIAFKDMMNTVAFDEEIMFYYKNYTEKIRKPDLIGKTVKVTNNQFKDIYVIISKIADMNEMEIPDTYIYEDFYYGVESKGADKPWIEISAKTITDLSKPELTFLIAREMCDINLKHTYYFTLINETMQALNHSSILGSDTLKRYWNAIMCRWSRIAYYTADCFGYTVCKDLSAAIGAIKKLILNNCYLADNMNLQQYIKQSEEINMLDDDMSNFTKHDELVPYGPVRIKNLIEYASSDKGIKSVKEYFKEEDIK